MTLAGEKIRIVDLKNPILTDAHAAELAYWNENPVDLTEPAILRAAFEWTGLDDFGPDNFRLRLRRWLLAVDNDADLTEFGRAELFRIWVHRYAGARLRLTDLLRRHPEIRDIEITQPVIVLGPARSGTTHLVNLLATDPRLRSLPLWELYEPIPSQGEEYFPRSPNRRLSRCTAECSRMASLLPLKAAMHTPDPNRVEEEIGLQGADFPLWMLEHITNRAVSHQDFDPDPTRHYNYMKTMLKALQWLRGPNRWVLKSPRHAMYLGPLLATFPDALIVMTHRDPLAKLQSGLTMEAYYARLCYNEVDLDTIVSRGIARTDRVLRAMVHERHLVPHAQLVNVFYHDFMADELGTVSRIYGAMGLGLNDDQRARMSTFLFRHPRNKHGQIVYDLPSDFGVDPDELRNKFSFYYERFPVEAEVR